MSDASLPTNHDIGFDVSPGTTYPSTFSTPIEFANPDSMLSGTLRGTQFVGSNTLQIDSTQNLITIKNTAASFSNQPNVLRMGQTSSSFLGLAVSDGTNDVLRIGSSTTGYYGMVVGNGALDTLFAGKDVNGNTVVKIAKTGYDAKTATNDQLIFNSSQNVFKIAKTDTVNLSFSFGSKGAGTAGTDVASVTVGHNLGYIPQMIVSLYDNFYGTYQPVSSGSLLGGGYSDGFGPAFNSNSSRLSWFNLSATTTQLIITFSSTWYISGATFPAISGGFTFKYYLLQETAT